MRQKKRKKTVFPMNIETTQQPGVSVSHTLQIQIHPIFKQRYKINTNPIFVRFQKLQNNSGRWWIGQTSKETLTEISEDFEMIRHIKRQYSERLEKMNIVLRDIQSV